jgi:hypothetical protein
VHHTDKTVVPKSVAAALDAAPNGLPVHLKQCSEEADEAKLVSIVRDYRCEQRLEG